MEDSDLLANSRHLRKNMTKEENKLWYQFLRKYPLQFKRQYPMGSYIVDFYCYKARLIVELDGSQHCEPEKQKYDQRRTEYLESQGFQVLRFSNLDVVRQFSAVCCQIDSIARARANPSRG